MDTWRVWFRRLPIITRITVRIVPPHRHHQVCHQVCHRVCHRRPLVWVKTRTWNVNTHANMDTWRAMFRRLPIVTRITVRIVPPHRHHQVCHRVCHRHRRRQATTFLCVGFLQVGSDFYSSYYSSYPFYEKTPYKKYTHRVIGTIFTNKREGGGENGSSQNRPKK